MKVELQYITGDLRYPSGIAWVSDEILLVSEAAGGAIVAVSTDGTTKTVSTTGGCPMGLAFGPDGILYICNSGDTDFTQTDQGLIPAGESRSYCGGSIQTLNLDTGELEALYEEAGDFMLRSPTDLVFDSHGGFWFTDAGKVRHRTRDRGGLYYANADGSRATEVIYPLDSPSGVALSPDESVLYVSEANQGRVYTWPVSAPGEIAGYFGPTHRGTLLSDPEGGAVFGSLAITGFGNLCVSTNVTSGVTMVSPDGIHYLKPIEELAVGHMCFADSSGAPRAYMTLSGSGSVVEVAWDEPGLKTAYSRREN